MIERIQQHIGLRVDSNLRWIISGVLVAIGIAAFFLVLQKRGIETVGAAAPNCSDGWRITGYYTPIETDFKNGPVTEVDVKDVGKMSFNSDFLRVVFDEEQGFGEGWGKTRFGWYLGNYGGQWHKASDPLDANNSPLKTNSIAVDNALILNDSIVTIPNLPGDWAQTSFIANDVGVTVNGKHIDVYTGEGKASETAMYKITFEEPENLQRVCFTTPAGTK